MIPVNIAMIILGTHGFKQIVLHEYTIRHAAIILFQQPLSNSLILHEFLDR